MRKLLISSLVVLAMAHAAIAECYFSWGFFKNDIRTAEDTLITEGTAFFYLGQGVKVTSSGFDVGNATYITSCGYSETGRNFGVFGGNSNSEPYGFATSDLITSVEAGQKFTLILLDKPNVTPELLATYKGKYILYEGVSNQYTYNYDPVFGEPVVYATFQTNDSYGKNDWLDNSGSKKTGFYISIQ